MSYFPKDKLIRIRSFSGASTKIKRMRLGCGTTVQSLDSYRPSSCDGRNAGWHRPTRQAQLTQVNASIAEVSSLLKGSLVWEVQHKGGGSCEINSPSRG